MADLRVGLIGYGLAGRVFHAPFIEAVDGIRLTAVVTSREAEVRERHPGVGVLPEPDGLWSRCDLVVLATPNRTHLPLALEALRHDRPVVVDKPLAASAPEAERWSGRPAAASPSSRTGAGTATSSRSVDSSRPGRSGRASLRVALRPLQARGRRRSLAGEGPSGRRRRPAPRPRHHLVDQAIQLFGPVRGVHSEADRVRLSAEVEDDAFLALEHGGGVRSHLWMSSIAPTVLPRFALPGVAGGFACDGLDPQEAQLQEGFRPGDPGFGAAIAPGRYTDRFGTSPYALARGDYLAFYRGVLEWLRSDAAPSVDPADAVAVLRVLDAARGG